MNQHPYIARELPTDRDLRARVVADWFADQAARAEVMVWGGSPAPTFATLRMEPSTQAPRVRVRTKLHKYPAVVQVQEHTPGRKVTISLVCGHSITRQRWSRESLPHGYPKHARCPKGCRGTR